LAQYVKYRQEKRAEMPRQKADTIRNKDRKRKRKPMEEHNDITSTTNLTSPKASSTPLSAIPTTPNSFAATVGSLIDSATPSKILRLREAGLRPQDERRVVEETISRVAKMA
jgi:hypothetical protein